MGQKIPWVEMKQAFPNEWVAIADIEGDLKHSYGEISGTVLVHHPDEGEFTQRLKKIITSDRLVDIRYTGELLPDCPVGPILWQISPTTS